MHACNCSHGPSDPRCCIARARRRELEEAHHLGREGKPLPAQAAAPQRDWGISRINAVDDSIARINAIRP